MISQLIQIAGFLAMAFLVRATSNTNTLNKKDATSTDDTVNTLSKLWSFTGCAEEEEKAIKNGLSEASTILLNPGTSDIGNHWDSYAVVEFFGPPVMVYNKRNDIKAIFWNARNYKDHWWSGNEAQVFCHDKPNINPDNPNSCASYGGHIKVEQHGGTDNALAIIFCSSWFNLGTLDAIFRSASTGPDKFDISKYDNRALHWVGAMVQLPSINPFSAKAIKNQILNFPSWTGDSDQSYVMGVERVKYLGKLFDGDYQVPKIMYNIDSWSWYAMATYVQDKLGEYPYNPPVPRSLPSMQHGSVIPAGEAASGDLPDDPDLKELQAVLDAD